MKSNIKSNKGFTIIELLVVIVVIGILAAITVVSYSGVTKNANDKAALSNAQSVATAAETYNAENEAYPSLANIRSGTYVTLPTGVSVVPYWESGTDTTPALSSTTTSSSTIIYEAKSTTGACIGYWNYNAPTPVIKWIAVGNATTSPTITNYNETGPVNAAFTCN